MTAHGRRGRRAPDGEPRPPAPPEVRPSAARGHHAAWRDIMRTIGRRVRRVRDFLGLSQEQVAALAGVSQGAVSRLEAGQALATPFVVVLGIQRVLTLHLRNVDPALLDPEILRVIELTELLDAPLGTGPASLTEDGRLERIIREYRAVPDSQRESLVAIVTAAADGLKSSS
jgi:transcriptional regulator with XRE-family HTH domain